MPTPIEDQVVEFYYDLFDRIFTQPFSQQIDQRLKRDAVRRQVEESAGAASQSLTLFFNTQETPEKIAAEILQSCAAVPNFAALEDIANPNVPPESLVDDLLGKLPGADALQEAEHGVVYRVVLHSVLQVLMLVSPVMKEWQKLSFGGTFELNRQIINRLNQISQQLDVLGRSGEAAADERYELLYRDHLLQRFHRVEAGTVRMTTNLAVDLSELFVMPQVRVRPKRKKDVGGSVSDGAETELMTLAVARRLFAEAGGSDEAGDDAKSQAKPIDGLELARKQQRCAIVGAGAGKSTFLEWLQLRIAGAEEELVLGDQQAIPLLLRVRQLDATNLPKGPSLIEKATASKDRAALMPDGWVHRQMRAGRFLFMLDGLDEVEPELRDGCVLPWLAELCKKYPKCNYLVSSRPVGYPPGTLDVLGFAESDLIDFGDEQIADYTRHWCTAVRLAQNEPREEARREGEKDGDTILQSFKGHTYIRDLARNPLMLSAICLVNYFEGGSLPEDRSKLYQLCTEGLLHHWDQRRGIHSKFAFDEKLRVCRELALAMQAQDRAECEATKVEKLFSEVLGDSAKAKELVEHIRYRTGLLIERRPEVFAFAHLTFQEYLAARAVHEGNHLGIDPQRLIEEHDDGRWHEVIALYCGVAPTRAARKMITSLIERPDTPSLAEVLAEAYFSVRPDLARDKDLRKRVIERIAVAPVTPRNQLKRFEETEVKQTANHSIGRIRSDFATSQSLGFFIRHPNLLDIPRLTERLRFFREMTRVQLCELIYLLHYFGSGPVLLEMASEPELYTALGPEFKRTQGQPTESYGLQAEIALIGLRQQREGSKGVEAVVVQCLTALSDRTVLPKGVGQPFFLEGLVHVRRLMKSRLAYQALETRRALASATRKLAPQLRQVSLELSQEFETWAHELEPGKQTKGRKGTTRQSKARA